jgi:hypothetical protein
MLEALGGEVSDSKLRLFACACCRRIWDVIDTEPHRRAVEYAEWFAHGPGRDLKWLGAGHWTGRRLCRPIGDITQTKGWAAIHRELQAELAGFEEDVAAFRYDHWSPQGTAAATLHLRYDMPYYVARGVASMRTAPCAYWQHAHAPQCSDEEEQRWVGRIERELASYCDLLHQTAGRPDLVSPRTTGDGRGGAGS